MAYWLDTNEIDIGTWEDQYYNTKCNEHSPYQIFEDSGEIWTICSGCRKILNHQNSKVPIIKKKKITIR